MRGWVQYRLSREYAVTNLSAWTGADKIHYRVIVKLMGGTIPTEQPAYNLAELHDMFFFKQKLMSYWFDRL